MPWVVKAGDYYVYTGKRTGVSSFVSDVTKTTVYLSREQAASAIDLIAKFRPGVPLASVEVPESDFTRKQLRACVDFDEECEKRHELFEARRMAICLLTWPILRDGSKNPWYCESLSENDRNGNRTFNAAARKTIDAMTEKVLRKEIAFGVTEDGEPNTPARIDHSYVGSRDNRLSGSKAFRNSKTYENRERRGNRVLRKQLRAE